MIAETVRGSGFRGVMAYLVAGRRRAEDRDRVAWSTTRNLAVDDPGSVVKVMRDTAALSVRVKKPVLHLVIAFHPEDRPSPDLMQNVADTTLADIGLDEHQAFICAHNDTAHPHLHIVVNRVHPATGRAWAGRQDWKGLEKSLRRQEQQHGLIYVPGRHSDRAALSDHLTNLRSSDFQRHRRIGRTPALPSWPAATVAMLKLDLAPVFAQARTWQDLEAGLPRHVQLWRKGQGLVLSDWRACAKLSSLGRMHLRGDPVDRPAERLTLKRLEQIFGQRVDEYLTARDARRLERSVALLSNAVGVATKNISDQSAELTPGEPVQEIEALTTRRRLDQLRRRQRGFSR